jgi:hypothetical protein
LRERKLDLPPNVGTTIGCEPPVCAGSQPFSCSCNPATRLAICSRDAAVDAEAKDAASTFPPNGADGPFLECTSTCNIDSSPVAPACVNGAWI